MQLLTAVLLLAIVAMYFGVYRAVVRLPKTADAALARGDRAGARRILERAAAIRWLTGSRGLAGIYHRLAWLDLLDQRPREAVENARRSVDAPLHPAIESIYRSRLADCLEAAGDPASAAAERDRARRAADAAPQGPAKLIARGRQLRRAGRYADAIPVYERAIAQAQVHSPRVRAHLIVSAALSCWEAGRLQDAVDWAGQALALDPDLPHRTSALSVSALALGSLGRLDEAEERWALALEAARQSGNTAAVARYLAMLAEVQRRRGRLAQALRTCEEAALLGDESLRTACFAAFECLRTDGRFEEARAKLDEGAAARGLAVPASERRIQAVVTMNRALLDSEEGRPEEGLELLDTVRDVLGADEKVGIQYYAMRAWTEALLGDREASDGSAAAARAAAVQMTGDRAALLGFHTHLGRAELALGRIAAARDHFEACTRLRPDPVLVPRTHYYLGECCRAEGDTAGARAHWQAAADAGFEIQHTRLALERLAGQV